MLGFEPDNPPNPDLVAHIIQVSLSPIFLLTALGTLLSVFSLRLARVADKVDSISEATKGASADEARMLSLQLVHFRHRSHALDVAIVLAAIGGAATCASVLTLFVGALRDITAATVLFALFGLAILCAIGAITAFEIKLRKGGGWLPQRRPRRRRALNLSTTQARIINGRRDRCRQIGLQWL
jgi:hypothetical protein